MARERKNDWTLLAEAQSNSNPNKWYRVALRVENGHEVVGCTCPAWTFVRNGRRGCKHIKDFNAGELIAGKNLKLTNDGRMYLRKIAGVDDEAVH